MQNTKLFGDLNSNNILIQATDQRELDNMEMEVRLIRELSGTEDFQLICVPVQDWNADLSPWPAPAVFAKQDFAGSAEETLGNLLKILNPIISQKLGREEVSLLIGGYSLAALFALWAATKTDLFQGVAAASPSAWFPGFTEYLQSNPIKAGFVYLSLGDKEHKTKNPVMATVKDSIQQIETMIRARDIPCVLEWNQGNHFQEPELRTAKGFAWILKRKAQK